MHSNPASTQLLATLASESPGAYDTGPPVPSPDEVMLALAAELEDVKRRMVNAWRDVAGWGGLPATRGWTGREFLTIEARLSRFEASRLEAMTSRLPALPVTAALLASGEITVEQAATICGETRRLSGAALATVERTAAEAARDRNRRGDDPDITGDVDLLVDEHRRPAEVEAAERRAVDGQRVHLQPSFLGGGQLFADLDDSGFASALTAIEDAAGLPDRDVPRRLQRAEGIVGIFDAWNAGRTVNDASPPPAPAADDAAVPPDPEGPPFGAVTAKPTITVLVDLAEATASTFGQTLTAATGGRARRLSARMLDVLSCNADLVLQLTDGRRPLAALKDQDALPAATRRAVLTRDRGCRWPGCRAPAWRIDVHHLVHRADGGDHHPDNLVGLCRRHHTRLHGTHWAATLDPSTAAFALSRRADGEPIHVTYPNGSRPPPAPALR